VDDLFEQLAAYSHDRAWAGWMRYMFSKCYLASDPDHLEDDDGSLIIPGDLVKRWRRQIETPYADLPEVEKASDREQAKYIMQILDRSKGVVNELTYMRTTHTGRIHSEWTKEELKDKPRCHCDCHTSPGTYPTTESRPCNSCGHVHELGYFPADRFSGWVEYWRLP
jgi:hypothetical protein